MAPLIECNFDGLVGPTHHFGGLGSGNLASAKHAGAVSHPRAAALQGLDKIAAVQRLADPARVRAAILPPAPRPHIDWLRDVGFSGDDAEILRAASQSSPQLLSAAWSASSMWTANAATVSPSCDTEDARLHLTVSNLLMNTHRSLEAPTTTHVLRQIFGQSSNAIVHAALPSTFAMRDEGAANHMRLSAADGLGGHAIFVHAPAITANQRFVGRQAQEACAAIARQHHLPPQRITLLEQHPDAIDAGAFHNDVVATSCDHILLYHEQAFHNADNALADLKNRFSNEHGSPPHFLRVAATEISLADAIDSYLFNSQIIPTTGGYALVCPMQCREIQSVHDWINRILTDDLQPITEVSYVELRESMANGGGPACLRLRVPLSPRQAEALPGGIWWTPELDARLRQMITTGYRETLTEKDLADPALAEEALRVTRDLYATLQLDWPVTNRAD